MLPGGAPTVDNLFLLAVAALGWGLSLDGSLFRRGGLRSLERWNR